VSGLIIINIMWRFSVDSFWIFFFNPGCLGQLTRTTTNFQTHWTLCKPSKLVKHCEDIRRVYWSSNSSDKNKKTLFLTLGHKRWCFFLDLIMKSVRIKSWICDLFMLPSSVSSICQLSTEHMWAIIDSSAVLQIM
jgi:hypothetical protein